MPPTHIRLFIYKRIFGLNIYPIIYMCILIITYILIFIIIIVYTII